MCTSAAHVDNSPLPNSFFFWYQTDAEMLQKKNKQSALFIPESLPFNRNIQMVHLLCI